MNVSIYRTLKRVSDISVLIHCSLLTILIFTGFSVVRTVFWVNSSSRTSVERQNFGMIFARRIYSSNSANLCPMNEIGNNTIVLLSLYIKSVLLLPFFQLILALCSSAPTSSIILYTECHATINNNCMHSVHVELVGAEERNTICS